MKKIIRLIMSALALTCAISLHAQDFHKDYVQFLREISVLSKDINVVLRREKTATVIETVKRLFDSADKNKKHANFSLEYLHDSLSGIIENTLQPNTVFGALFFTETLAHQYDSQRLLDMQKLVKVFLEQKKEDSQELKKNLKNLEQQAGKVFINGNIAQWVKIAKTPPPSVIKTTITSLVTHGLSSYGLSYLATPGSWTYGISSWIGTGIASSLMASMFGHYAGQKEILADMTTFFELLTEAIKNCKKIIESQKDFNDNQVLKNLVYTLELPSTLDPSWETIIRMLKSLQAIGKIDACFVLAERLTEQKVIPIILTTETQSKEQLDAGLDKINCLCTGKEQLPVLFDEENKQLILTPNQEADITPDSLTNLLVNITLSQTLGVIQKAPNVGILNEAISIPLIFLPTIVLKTETIYGLNEKQENLNFVVIAHS